MNKPDEVQFIRQPKMRNKTRHGGQWKIAYADFVTAMMVFFLIMWIVSMIPQIQKDNIADYFKGTSQSKIDEASSNKTGSGATTDKKEDVTLDEVQQAKQYLERMKELRKDIEAFMKENTALMNNSNEILIQDSPDGLTITLAENKKPMFLLGGATLEATTAQVLQKLGKPLSESNFKVKIEGHTDSSGYRPGATYSNWELSADRANAARRELLAGGLSEDKISEVVGYADRNLFVPDDPKSGLNRRITITAFTPQVKNTNTQNSSVPMEDFAANSKQNAVSKDGKPTPGPVPEKGKAP
jgi:chemotaxis protein MotB